MTSPETVLRREPLAGRRRFLQIAAILASMPLVERVHALGLPRPAAVPGGFAVINLGADILPPVAHFNGDRVFVAGNKSGWLAIVGISLDAQPGLAPPVSIRYSSGKLRDVQFTIEPKEYQAEFLTMGSGSGYVDLNVADFARCEAERAHLQRVLRTYTEAAPASLLLAPPCQGTQTSSFGLVRFFNGQARGAHNGMDIAAPVGKPVYAAGAGEVIDIGDYFYSGRTVIINHGRGFFSFYAHLSETHVRRRKGVTPGQLIGKIGSTGRSTGPHLHFAVYLNAAAVDPTLFLLNEPRINGLYPFTTSQDRPRTAAPRPGGIELKVF